MDKIEHRAIPAIAFLPAFLLVLVLMPIIPSFAETAKVNFWHRGQSLDAAVQVEVEFARTPEQRARGLQFRQELPLGEGMLFLFSRTEPVEFWMKDTFIPLDLVFIGESGEVVHIHRWATPLSERRIESKFPVRAVLEIIGGSAAELGIEVGMLSDAL